MEEVAEKIPRKLAPLSATTRALQAVAVKSIHLYSAKTHTHATATMAVGWMSGLTRRSTAGFRDGMAGRYVLPCSLQPLHSNRAFACTRRTDIACCTQHGCREGSDTISTHLRRPTAAALRARHHCVPVCDATCDARVWAGTLRCTMCLTPCPIPMQCNAHYTCHFSMRTARAPVCAPVSHLVCVRASCYPTPSACTCTCAQTPGADRDWILQPPRVFVLLGVRGDIRQRSLALLCAARVVHLNTHDNFAPLALLCAARVVHLNTHNTLKHTWYT